MNDWERKLDKFLRFNERKVLSNAGQISKKEADNHAKGEYEQFEIIRREHQEVIAETEYLKQLEEAAKKLPAPKKHPGKSADKKGGRQ